MFNRVEIVEITHATISGAGGPFPIHSTTEKVLAVFKYYEDAKHALKGMLAEAKPGVTMAIRYYFGEGVSSLYDQATVPHSAVELDQYDGVPADTGTV